MVARRRGARKSANNGSSIRPAEAEICAAVESLYADELKPVGRLLRRRLHERAVADMPLGDVGSGVLAVSEVDVEYIRSVCNTCPMINVEPEVGGDWSALLIGRPSAFVELCGPDVYPSGLWDALAAELQTLDATGSLDISGGRYACALALFSQGLPSLAGCSLGRVSHIVQLAIAEKRLLGYRGGEIVLYDRSSSKAKEQRAVSQEAPSSLGQGISEMPVATWELARSCLQSILLHSSSHGAPAAVALSRVKCLFRCHCGVELSETRLGYSKLSELLQDEHFSDICSVQLGDSGYCVYQRDSIVETSMSGKYGKHRTDDNSTSQPVLHRLDEPLPLVAVSCPPPEIRVFHVKNTFIHFPSPVSPSTSTARHRARSVPRSFACSLDLDAGASSAQTPPSTCLPFSPALTASPQSVSQNLYWPDVDLRQGSIDSSAAIYFQSRALVVPEMAWWSAHEGENWTSSVSVERDCHRKKFCVDEPLELEDVGLTTEVPRQVSLDIHIKNTFVHASTSHTTPLRAPARRRARSVPKDMGSSDATERMSRDTGNFIDAISSCSEVMPFFGPSPSNCFAPSSPVVSQFLQQPPPAPFPTFGQAQMLSECQTEMQLAEFAQMALPFAGYVDLMCSTTDCSCDSAEDFTDASSTASSQICTQTSDSSRETVFLSLVEALGAAGSELHAHSTCDLDEGSICSILGGLDSASCTATQRAQRWCDEKDDDDDDDGVDDAGSEMLAQESCQHNYTSVSSRKKRQQRRRCAYHCTSVGNSKRFG